MNECKTDGSCEPVKGTCCCPECGKQLSCDCCNMAEDILFLAKHAKHELLKEKMKKVIETKMGKKLDQIADFAVEAFLACHEHKMSGKQAFEGYKEKLLAVYKS